MPRTDEKKHQVYTVDKSKNPCLPPQASAATQEVEQSQQLPKTESGFASLSAGILTHSWLLEPMEV